MYRLLLFVPGLLLMAVTAVSIDARGVGQFPTPEAAREALVPFLGVIDQYRSGRTGLATVQALGWSRRDIEGFRSALSERSDTVDTASAGPGSLTAADIEAAVLLHTDACLAFAEVGDGDGAWLHLDAAQSMLNWLEQLSVVRPGLRIRTVLVPRREWYVAAVTALNGARMPDLAAPLAATALRDYPSDPVVLLAAAVNSEARALIQEQLGDLGDLYGLPSLSTATGRPQPGRDQVLQFLDPQVPARRDVRALRSEALEHLAGVLAADPENADARLRQARLLALVGRDGEAVLELAALSVGAGPVPLRYLAYLFLGQIQESAGRLVEAESAYRRATALEPLAQTSRVALAHVMARTDRRAEAQAVLVPALDRNRPVSLVSDPFWVYPYIDPVKSRAPLKALRYRVLR